MANWNAMSWSEDVETGDSGLRHMLTTLCLACTDEYRVFSDAKRLGARMELSTRRVYDRIDKLAERGLVTKIRRVRPNGSEAKPITLLNHPDAPHMHGRPVVLDYEGKHLYPRDPQALTAAGLRWIAAGAEGGVHPSHELVDNSDQPDEASPPQPDEASCCQPDETSPPCPDEASPPKQFPFKGITSSLGFSVDDEAAPEAVEPDQQEEEEEEPDKTDQQPSSETELLEAYARFRPGKYLGAEARQRCVELLGKHRVAGWSDETLAGYLRDWAAEAHNPSTYLVDKLGSLGAPRSSAPRPPKPHSTRDERPAPASEATIERRMREMGFARRGGGAA